MPYRAVYGETMPAWEKIVPTTRAADRFKRQREHVGDVIFSQTCMLHDLFHCVIFCSVKSLAGQGNSYRIDSNRQNLTCSSPPSLKPMCNPGP
jgi:hypothetical protein